MALRSQNPMKSAASSVESISRAGMATLHWSFEEASETLLGVLKLKNPDRFACHHTDRQNDRSTPYAG